MTPRGRRHARALLGALALALLAAGCARDAPSRYVSRETRESGRLSAETLRLNASAPPLQVRRAELITDNDTAFERKLALIDGATRQIDLAYFIYADDYSTAVLTEALLRAAARGVRVRVLLDYFRNYRHLDHYAMMERHGAGRLEVRFYNRPTVHIVKDAVYLTTGCGDVTPGGALPGCSEAKFARIDQQFEALRAAAPPGAPDPGLNENSGGSGLLLSGLYGQNVEVLVSAITEGQDLIGPEVPARDRKPLTARQVDLAIEGGTVYWRARASNPRRLQQLANRTKLELAFALFGERLHGLRDMLTAYFPVERREGRRDALRDWDYLTAFLHHKLLLVDERAFQLGGRNLEDSYHVGPTPLVTRYLFRDTDAHVELAAGGEALTRTFDRLWEFRAMVATLDDIRQHAPNDALMAIERAAAECAEAGTGADDPVREACRARATALHADPERRIAERHRDVQAKAARFRQEYRPAPASARAPDLPVDAGAQVLYVENLPFEPGAGPPPVRLYAPRRGLEGESGKHIHGLWLQGLRQACRLATAERPQRVVMHNAYFIPPANILRELGAMVRGDVACPHVDVTVLTNSPETTDLSVINLVGRYVIKAVADHGLRERRPARAARFAYHEYVKVPGEGPGRSLHSKVMVLGPDLFVGSANADVRSYVLDSNNGLYVREAPALVAAYLASVDRMLGESREVADRTRYFVDTPRARFLEEDRPRIAATMRRLAGSAAPDATIPVDHVALRLSAILERAYQLSADVVRGGRGAAEAERLFDALFKVL